MSVICVDFDGTCVKHEYPEIGEDIGAVQVLKRLALNGHALIIFTMRSGQELDDAVNWFMNKGIPLSGINTNPTQSQWTTSPKAYGNLYIDDAALGVPLVRGADGIRPYVDWIEVEKYLIENGFIK